MTTNNDEKEILNLSGHCRTQQHELEALKNQLEISFESVSELKRKLAKSEADFKSLKSKYDTDILLQLDDISDQNLSLKSKLEESNRQKENLVMQLEELKKVKSKLLSELNSVKADLYQSNMISIELERKASEKDTQTEKQKLNLLDMSNE